MICSHNGQSGRFCAACGARLRWECQKAGCNFQYNFYPAGKFCPNCGTQRPDWVK